MYNKTLLDTFSPAFQAPGLRGQVIPTPFPTPAPTPAGELAEALEAAQAVRRLQGWDWEANVTRPKITGSTSRGALAFAVAIQ